MSRYSALERHPNRARLENELLAGKNILVIAQETGISASALYRAKATLVAEREAMAEATTDASRLGTAKRLALLAADARRARLDAALKGNGRLAKDLIETERRLLADIAVLAPEGQQLEDARENELFAGALVEVLKASTSVAPFDITLEYLKANHGPQNLIDAVTRAASKLQEVVS